MDQLKHSYYEVVFERNYLKKGGNEFQDFFSEIMEKCHPGDFQRVCPWGSAGDRKNDGYLPSKRILFQVYAPNKMIAKAAIAKIHEDFHGALQYWQKYFNTWIFVHNSKKGLGPQITEKLNELATFNVSLKVKPWGFEELRQNVFTLNEADLASLLGPAPSARDMLDVRYSNVQEVISHIARQEPPLLQDIRPVPPDKLNSNHLSPYVQNMLLGVCRKQILLEISFMIVLTPHMGTRLQQLSKRNIASVAGWRWIPIPYFISCKRSLEDPRGDLQLTRQQFSLCLHISLSSVIYSSDHRERLH